jgi:hypothetical protein
MHSVARATLWRAGYFSKLVVHLAALLADHESRGPDTLGTFGPVAVLDLVELNAQGPESFAPQR